MLQSAQRSHSSTDRTGVSEISDVGSIPAEGTTDLSPQLFLCVDHALHGTRITK